MLISDQKRVPFVGRRTRGLELEQLIAKINHGTICNEPDQEQQPQRYSTNLAAQTELTNMGVRSFGQEISEKNFSEIYL